MERGIGGRIVLERGPVVERAADKDGLLEVHVLALDGAVDLERVEQHVLERDALVGETLTEVRVVAGGLGEVERVDGDGARQLAEVGRVVERRYAVVVVARGREERARGGRGAFALAAHCVGLMVVVVVMVLMMLLIVGAGIAVLVIALLMVMMMMMMVVVVVVAVGGDAVGELAVEEVLDDFGGELGRAVARLAHRAHRIQLLAARVGEEHALFARFGHSVSKQLLNKK